MQKVLEQMNIIFLIQQDMQIQENTQKKVTHRRNGAAGNAMIAGLMK